MSSKRLSLTLAWALAWGAPAAAQTIINSPPTVISFAGLYTPPAGAVMNVYDGAEIYAALGLNFGATLNLYGGELTQGVDVGDGSFVNIYSGNITSGPSGRFGMGSGSHTVMRGGWFNRTIFKQTTAELVMEGVDFAFDGVPVAGLVAPGDEVTLTVPVGAFFTGVFANGSPFTFSNRFSSGDSFYGEVTLRQSARPTGPAVVHVPSEPMPPGILPGQTLVVNDGAELPNGMNGAPGSKLDVRGGRVRAFEAYQSNVAIAGGDGGSITAYAGSHVAISGGATGRIAARDGATVDVHGGAVNTLVAFPGADVTIDGGVVQHLQLVAGAEAELRGGEITGEVDIAPETTFRMTGGLVPQRLSLPQPSTFIMSGGRIGSADEAIIMAPGVNSEIELIGRQFLLGDQPIPGLSSPGDSIVLMERPDLHLYAILADGSPLKTYVGTVRLPPGPIRSHIGGTLRLTLVPEPAGMGLAIAALGVLAAVRRMP